MFFISLCKTTKKTGTTTGTFRNYRNYRNLQEPKSNNVQWHIKYNVNVINNIVDNITNHDMKKKCDNIYNDVMFLYRIIHTFKLPDCKETIVNRVLSRE